MGGNRLVRKAHPPFDGVREVDQPVRLVEDPDVQHLRIEDLAQPLAHEVVHRLDVELRGEALLDLVDDRQLRRPLVGVGEEALCLVEQAGVLERDPHRRGNRRQQALGGAVELVLLEALEREHAEDLVRDEDRHPQPRCRVDTGLDRTERGQLLIRAEPDRRPALDDLGGEPDAERDRIRGDASTLVELVAERHQVGGRVVGRDEHRGRVELLPHPLADELDDRVELELLGEAAADLVDEGELGGPLAGGLDRANARQGRGDGSADDGHERDVVRRVALFSRVRLDDEGADRPVLGDQRDAQPVTFADDAQAGDLAGRLELAEPRGGEQQRDARAQQVRGDARGVPDAERLPQERIRQVVVELVDVVGEVDGLARIVVQRDVAVRRVGERLERLVDDRVERAQVVGPVGGVDDRDEGTLDAQLLLQLRNARRGIGVTVGAHAWLRLPDPHPVPHDAAAP